MDDFVPLGLALVRPHDIHHAVFLQEVLGDVGAEVRAGAPQSVGDAAVADLGVRPENVEHLERDTDAGAVSEVVIFYLFPFHLIDEFRAWSRTVADRGPQQRGVLKKRHS